MDFRTCDCRSDRQDRNIFMRTRIYIRQPQRDGN
jgi:hypothetical protein